MCRHIYDWNIVNYDVKQPIQLNSTKITIYESVQATKKGFAIAQKITDIKFRVLLNNSCLGFGNRDPKTYPPAAT